MTGQEFRAAIGTYDKIYNSQKKTFKIKFHNKKWKDVRVGDIIKVYENQYFPCDMILINSSGEKGICYVETKNLDGETNLKHKKASKECVDMSQNENEIVQNFKSYEITCDKENELIYVFNGCIKMSELLTIGLSEE